MNGEEKILQILETMQGEMSAMKSDLAFVKGAAFRIENDHGTRLRALSDEVSVINEKLDRIERKVGRHDLRMGSYEEELERLKAK